MKLKELIAEAREAGCTELTIEGITYKIGAAEPQRSSTVPEMEAKDIVKPMSVLEDLTEDEILFWATPYYDQLQDQKAEQEQLRKEQTRG